MALEAGSKLGTFEILAPLGAGGMGEVYRARDTRLGRDVAIKVLPTARDSDPVALGRFEREIKAVAALNHPNVLSIYDYGTHEGTTYAVMELLNGKTLRALLQDGPIPISRVVDFGIQLTKGLAAAHEKGIIHRDLKPENILITRDDHVKILDFGLAKSIGNERDNTKLSTASAYTEPGTVMGTAGYMSPEQVRGTPVDHRSDLFSLGVILYEMLTARRAFARGTSAETMTAVLREDPPPVPESLAIPPAFVRVVQHCLEKDPENRFQTARDLGFAFEAISLPTTAPMKPPENQKKSFRFVLPLAGLIVLASVMGFLMVRGRRAKPPEIPPSFGGGTLIQLTTDPGYEGEPTFSSDGETIAYVSDREGNSEIYLQQVSGGGTINLTKSPSTDIQPSFSRDGRQIAFVSNRSSSSDIFVGAASLPLVGGDIWIMPALGGSPRRIVENGNFPSWSPDNRWILYTHGTFRQSHIAIVSADGGTPRDIELSGIDVERLLYPTFSEDGKWILFQNSGAIYVVSAQGGKANFLVTGHDPCWGPGSASILYMNLNPGKNGTLWQSRFSPELGRLEGSPWPITFGRGPDENATVSRDGHAIVFSAQDHSLNLEELPFDAEKGVVTGPPRALTEGSNQIGGPSPSPDGNSVVYSADRGANSHLWRLDPSGSAIQITMDENYSDRRPAWSTDGKRIAFIRHNVTNESEKPGLWMISTDGANPRRLMDLSGQLTWMDPTHLLAQRSDNQIAMIDVDSLEVKILPFKVRTLFNVERKSRWLVYQSADRGNVDIMAVPIDGGQPKLVVATPHEDYHPSFSPSGNWLYFQPDHKNLYRVPGPGQQWRSAPPEKVTDFPEAGLFLEDPQISPTGARLYYARGRKVGDLWLIRLPDSAPPQ